MRQKAWHNSRKWSFRNALDRESLTSRTIPIPSTGAGRVYFCRPQPRSSHIVSILWLCRFHLPVNMKQQDVTLSVVCVSQQISHGVMEICLWWVYLSLTHLKTAANVRMTIRNAWKRVEEGISDNLCRGQRSKFEVQPSLIPSTEGGCWFSNLTHHQTRSEFFKTGWWQGQEDGFETLPGWVVSFFRTPLHAERQHFPLPPLNLYVNAGKRFLP